MAGKNARECTFRCGMLIGSTSVSRMNGQSPEPNGRGSILIPLGSVPSQRTFPRQEATKTYDAMGEGVTFYQRRCCRKPKSQARQH